MTDLCLCADGRTCGMRDTCYRYRAVPHDHRPAAAHLMRDWREGGAEKCPHYWDATYFAAQLLTVAEADNNRTPEDAQ